jgi:hypothetical protein
MHPDEEAIIRAFIAPARRARWLQLLASPQRRSAFLDRLNHCRDIDERFATPLPSNADVVRLLRGRGAPETCYVISDTAENDGLQFSLEEAIERTIVGGWGTLVSCIPGKLAYYYDECGTRRMLLERS